LIRIGPPLDSNCQVSWFLALASPCLGRQPRREASQPSSSQATGSPCGPWCNSIALMRCSAPGSTVGARLWVRMRRQGLSRRQARLKITARLFFDQRVMACTARGGSDQPTLS
jgi:hypothetical protein